MTKEINPMKDRHENIEHVMNLILPNTKEEQLQTKEDFIEQF
jgi:hypothetical protein